MNESKLACEGGTPVRATPLPPKFLGASLVGAEEKEFLVRVIDSRCLFRHYGPGAPHFADDFEREFRQYIGVRYALGTATGSGAYFCAMRALDIGPGDEVVIPAYGWITDYAMVDHFGAVPVLASIDESMNISPEDFEARITPRTKAVVVIYYQGAAARVDEIVRIARRHNIKVFEDVAQAVGCEFEGRKLGAWGDIACYSLQVNKMITSGDGGVLTTNDQRMYEKAVRYHDLGLLRKTFENNLEGPLLTEPMAGMQWRMGELAAAVALAQLRKLPKMIEDCRERAAFLRESLRLEFPSLKFRAVRPENDAGILVAFDLRSAQNVKFFSEAYAAEGLVYGPTSWCEPITRIPQVAVRLKENGVCDKAVEARTVEVDGRMAKLAVAPKYSHADMQDIASGAIKVLRAMSAKGML